MFITYNCNKYYVNVCQLVVCLFVLIPLPNLAHANKPNYSFYDFVSIYVFVSDLNKCSDKLDKCSWFNS